MASHKPDVPAARTGSGSVADKEPDDRTRTVNPPKRILVLTCGHIDDAQYTRIATTFPPNWRGMHLPGRAPVVWLGFTPSELQMLAGNCVGQIPLVFALHEGCNSVPQGTKIATCLVRLRGILGPRFSILALDIVIPSPRPAGPKPRGVEPEPIKVDPQRELQPIGPSTRA